MAQSFGKSAGQAGIITVAALTVGQAAQGLTFTAFTPSLPQMAQSFNGGGHGMAIAQQSVTIAAFGIIAGSFISGKIVEFFGSRATILVSLLLFGATGAGGLFLQQVWTLLASRVITGFAAACTITACINAISNLFQGHGRARTLGISAGIGSATALAGMLIGGILAQRFGWRETFIQFPIFALLGFGLVLFGLRNTEGEARPELESHAHIRGRLWPLYLLAVIISTIMFMGSSQFAFLLPEDGVTKATSISHIMAAITVVAVPVSFAFGAIERQLGMNGTLAIGLAVNAAGLALIGLIPTASAAVCGAALMGIYVGITMPYLYHAITLKTASENRVKAIGMIGAFNFLGAFLNPFIFAPAGALLGMHGLFLAAGIFMGALTVAVLFTSHGLFQLQTVQAKH